MAKIKVHELAKEIEKQSKEVIAYLQSKGIEVKAAQSAVEDEAAAMVRRELGKQPAAGDEAKAGAAAKSSVAQEKAGSDAGMKGADGVRGGESAKSNAQNEPGSGESVKTARKAEQAKGESGRQEPVKKKKNIIFVSNPHNSKLTQRTPGGSGNGGKRNGQGQGRNNGGGNRNNNRNNNPNSPITRPLIRPLTPPSPTPSVGQIKPVQQPKRPQKPQEAARSQQETTPKSSTASAAPVTRTQGTDHRQDRRGAERTVGSNDRRGRQADNRPGNNRFQKDMPGRQGVQGRGRGFNDNNRPEKGNGREDNKFRKPSGAKAFVTEAPVKDTEKHRDDEKRRQNQDRDKRSRKDAIYEDGNGKNKNRPGKFIKPEKKAEEKKEEQIKTIVIPDKLTVKELADKMKIQPSVIVKKLFLQGQVVTVNQEISFETAEEIAIEYEIICEREVKVDVIEELLKEEEEK